MHTNPYKASVEPVVPAKPPQSAVRPLHRARLYVFLGLWCLFTIWTYLIVNGGLDASSGKNRAVLRTTAATILGPMTGAISRDLQSCCLKFSLSLLPYCAAFAGFGILAQIVPLPEMRLVRLARIFLWTVGWIGWFMGGIVSFGHALG